MANIKGQMLLCRIEVKVRTNTILVLNADPSYFRIKNIFFLGSDMKVAVRQLPP